MTRLDVLFSKASSLVATIIHNQQVVRWRNTYTVSIWEMIRSVRYYSQLCSTSGWVPHFQFPGSSSQASWDFQRGPGVLRLAGEPATGDTSPGYHWFTLWIPRSTVLGPGKWQEERTLDRQNMTWSTGPTWKKGDWAADPDAVSSFSRVSFLCFWLGGLYFAVFFGYASAWKGLASFRDVKGAKSKLGIHKCGCSFCHRDFLMFQPILTI